MLTNDDEEWRLELVVPRLQMQLTFLTDKLQIIVQLNLTHPLLQFYNVVLVGVKAIEVQPGLNYGQEVVPLSIWTK